MPASPHRPVNRSSRIAAAQGDRWTTAENSAQYPCDHGQSGAVGMRIRVMLATVLTTSLAAQAAPLPDPFGPPQRHWAKLPDGRAWGTSAGIEIGPHGEIWV